MFLIIKYLFVPTKKNKLLSFKQLKFWQSPLGMTHTYKSLSNWQIDRRGEKQKCGWKVSEGKEWASPRGWSDSKTVICCQGPEALRSLILLVRMLMNTGGDSRRHTIKVKEHPLVQRPPAVTHTFTPPLSLSLLQTQLYLITRSATYKWVCFRQIQNKQFILKRIKLIPPKCNTTVR